MEQNSSTMDIYERQNYACMILSLVYVHELSADS